MATIEQAEAGVGAEERPTADDSRVEQLTERFASDGALALSVDSESDGESITREQRRSRRKRAIRARTISVKRMTKRELEIGRMLYPETDYYKPRTRTECTDAPRPCPYVSCKHHLYLDVSAKTGAIKVNFPDLEVWDMGETCALDVADRGGTTLEDVGAIMNLTRERIRQVEVKALAKLHALKEMMDLREYVDEGPIGKRRLPVLRSEDEEDEEDDLEASDGDDADDEAAPALRARGVEADDKVLDADLEAEVEA